MTAGAALGAWDDVRNGVNVREGTPALHARKWRQPARDGDPYDLCARYDFAAMCRREVRANQPGGDFVQRER
jgi:hypothetical protein